ncbi:MAG: nitrogen regulatory protein PII, partial [Halioglobus sp.]
MKPCKRMEIVIETPQAKRLSALLTQVGAGGYTLIPDVRGAGNRGERRADALAGDSSNCLFVIACEDQEIVDAIVEAVRPLLTRSGGICLVSDAQWL